MFERVTYGKFFTMLCQEMGWPTSEDNLRVLACVSIIEGPNDPEEPPARYNPLNSEVPYGSSTRWNSVGVQDYITFVQGLQGSIALLKGSHWVGVRSAMANGSDYHTKIEAWIQAYTWARPNFLGVTFAQCDERIARVIGYYNFTNAPTPIEHTEKYTVIAGDTLGKIAEHFYGHSYDYTRIAYANHIAKPYVIYPGERLVIPL